MYKRILRSLKRAASAERHAVRSRLCFVFPDNEGDYTMLAVSLFVHLCMCWITEKVVDGFRPNFQGQRPLTNMLLASRPWEGPQAVNFLTR